MDEPPPPSYHDVITGNFSTTPSEPPPPPFSPPVSVTTSFIGPERYKAPESIVSFPSPPLPATTSPPPSPGHQFFFSSEVSEQVRDRDVENSCSDERKGKIIKVSCFIVVVFFFMLVLSKDDCSTLPPQVDKTHGSFINWSNRCVKHGNRYYSDGCKCTFKCSGDYILSSSKTGYKRKYETKIDFTCVRGKWTSAPKGPPKLPKDKKLECLTITDFKKQNIG